MTVFLVLYIEIWLYSKINQFQYDVTLIIIIWPCLQHIHGIYLSLATCSSGKPLLWTRRLMIAWAGRWYSGTGNIPRQVSYCILVQGHTTGNWYRLLQGTSQCNNQQGGNFGCWLLLVWRCLLSGMIGYLLCSGLLIWKKIQNIRISKGSLDLSKILNIMIGYDQYILV